MEAAIAAVERAGGEVRLKPGGFAFVVDDCVTISVRLVCNRRTVKDPFGWDLRVGNAYADLIVAARIETETSTVLDYYLFPGSVVTKKYCRLASRKRTYWNEYRYMSLDTLPNLIPRNEERDYDSVNIPP